MKSDQKTEKLILVNENNSNWRNIFPIKIKELYMCRIEITFQDYLFNCKDLKDIQNLCQLNNLEIYIIKSNIIETVISASSLGFRSELINTIIPDYSDSDNFSKQNNLLHKGTLRSGEILESEGDLIILGDVNPGAIVRANENIIIWGRLLGTAHAGKGGNYNSKISALQLRPLQLRISDKVARGPKEKPEEGLAEQAEIERGEIVIKPAKTI
tara:strand:+ start:372 stop:1010 length:639 start_codon:yes stop_codon:yes gene_type:complete